MTTWAFLSESELVRNGLNTALLLLAMMLLRRLTVRAIHQRLDLPPESMRRWIVTSRHATIFLVLFGLMLIWGQELRALALSVVAIAAAVVIATKELILCLSGAFYRASSRGFGLGDRIEVGTVRGDVIDMSLMSTTVLEVGPGAATHKHTGRTVVLPNSLLLNGAVSNETFFKRFGFHVFTVPVRLEEDWQAAETLLLEAAQAECGPYLEEARRHMEERGREYGVDAPSVRPQVHIQMPEPGRVNLVVRVPVRGVERGLLEQAIMRRFLPRYQAAVRSRPTAAPSPSA